MSYIIPGSCQPLPAHTPRDLVYYLLGNSRTHMQFSLQIFMRHFAMTFYDMSGGLLLSTDHPDSFVEDLVNHGWLEQK